MMWSEQTGKGFMMVEMQAGGGGDCVPDLYRPGFVKTQEIWLVKLSHIVLRRWVDTALLNTL